MTGQIATFSAKQLANLIMSSRFSPQSIQTAGQHAHVWKLAGPIILSNISVPLVGIVDTAVVGHLPDPVYIGAVAIGATIFSFIFWGFGFLRMGTTGFVAQAWGANDGDEVRAIAARAGLLALLLGAMLIILQIPIAWSAFSLLDTSDNLQSQAQNYFDIRIWAAPATLANYAIIGCLIGMQNTRAVFITQLFLNLTNMLLDLVFVMGLGMDVEGVALATLISEYAAAGVGICLLSRQLEIIPGQFNGRDMFLFSAMRALLSANVNIMIRTLCLIVAFFLFTAKGSEYGEAVLAANAVLLHLLHLVAYGLDGFAHAAEALVGNAVGARNYAAFKRAVRVTSLWAILVSMVFAGTYFFLGNQFVALLTNIESVRELSHDYLPWLIIAPVISVWSYQLDGIFIGATRTAEMRNAMAVSLLIYLVLVALLTKHYGNHGLWLALILFNLARALCLAPYFLRLKNELK